MACLAIAARRTASLDLAFENRLFAALLIEIREYARRTYDSDNVIEVHNRLKGTTPETKISEIIPGFDKNDSLGLHRYLSDRFGLDDYKVRRIKSSEVDNYTINNFISSLREAAGYVPITETLNTILPSN